MKLRSIDKISIAILNIIALPISIWAQTDVLPRPYEVYGGTIGVIDAIPIPGETNKTRVFASTDSANSVFYADVDYSNPEPFGTNFMFRVVPGMDANASLGTPTWIAAHQQSGRIFAGTSSGLVSCAASTGSITTDITIPMGGSLPFVLIQDSSLFAYAVCSPTTQTLYYGTLGADGNLTLGPSLSTNFSASLKLAINPVNRKLYVLSGPSTNSTLLKSSDDYDAFSSGTYFSPVSLTGVTLSSLLVLTVGPDGRLFLGGGDTNADLAWSDNDGGSWTNLATSGSGNGIGLNIVCSGSSNAYKVYFGKAVNSNKGSAGTWSHPMSRQYAVNPGSIKVDPLNSNVVYFTMDRGFGISTNAGVDVAELNNGLLAVQIYDIDVMPSKSVAWICGSVAGICRATNFNGTPVWTDGYLPSPRASCVAIDKTDPSGMTGYAGAGSPFKTTTGGGTNASAWNSVFTNELPSGYASSIKASGNFIVFSCVGYSQTNCAGGVYMTRDGGTNWNNVITNVNVNKLLFLEEDGTGVVYAAASKTATLGRGGIYRLDTNSLTAVMDMTNEVDIRDLAADSMGGIYASGTVPDVIEGRHKAVAYYKGTNSTEWTLLTTDGLPGNLENSSMYVPIAVGKDSASNDVPVLAAERTVYYLPYGGSSWVTVENYPNGTQIRTLFWDELMVGTTIGLYGQGLPTATVLADPVIVDIAGNWYVWSSGLGYQRGGPWSLGLSGTPVAGDFDGDRYADPAVVDSTGAWCVWFSSLGYRMGGPFSLGVSGTPVAGDFDGDRYADPAMVDSTGAWRVWFTSVGYRMGGPYNLGVSGTPLAADFDGDMFADPAMVDNTGAWRVWYTSLGYRMGGPYNLGVSGTPLAGDFDGDGYADPAMVDSTGAWRVWFTSMGYRMGGPWGLGVSGTPLAADFDGR